MEYVVGDRYFNGPPQRSLNLIDGIISSYRSILNSTERLNLIKQANNLSSVLGDIYYECLGVN